MIFSLATILKTGQKFWILSHLSEWVDVSACVEVRAYPKIPRVHRCLHYDCRLQRSCGKVMFSQASLILFARGVSVQGVSVQGGLCTGGLC